MVNPQQKKSCTSPKPSVQSGRKQAKKQAQEQAQAVQKFKERIIQELESALGRSHVGGALADMILVKDPSAYSSNKEPGAILCEMLESMMKGASSKTETPSRIRAKAKPRATLQSRAEGLGFTADELNTLNPGSMMTGCTFMSALIAAFMDLCPELKPEGAVPAHRAHLGLAKMFDTHMSTLKGDLPDDFWALKEMISSDEFAKTLLTRCDSTKALAQQMPGVNADHLKLLSLAMSQVILQLEACRVAALQCNQIVQQMHIADPASDEFAAMKVEVVRLVKARNAMMENNQSHAVTPGEDIQTTGDVRAAIQADGVTPQLFNMAVQSVVKHLEAGFPRIGLTNPTIWNFVRALKLDDMPARQMDEDPGSEEEDSEEGDEDME